MSLLHTRRLVTYALLLSSLAVPALAQVSRIRNATTTNPPPGDAGRGDVKRASCVLQLDHDANRGNRTFDVQTLNALLTSTALVDPAAEKTLGLGSDQWAKVVQIEVVPAGNSAVRLGVTITQDAQTKLPLDAARLLLGELAARAKVAVDAAGSRQEKSREERLGALEAELAAAQKELEKASGKVREARFAGGEGERISGTLTQSRMDRESLEINLRAQQARLVVLEAERQRVMAAATTRPAAGAPQTSPWQDLIAAREKIAAMLRDKKATGFEADLALLQAEASVAEARALGAFVRLDRRDIDPAERWQQEIVSLKASIAENEARLAAINERFPKASTTQPTTPPMDVEQLRQDEAMARNKVNEIRQLVEQFRRDSRNTAIAPTLIILDGKSGS